MAARVLCIASAKGGSGKTVLTATLGHFLGALGKQVLLIDCDAATNGLTLLYLHQVIERRDEARSSHVTLNGSFDESADSTVSPVELTGYVHLLPATYYFVDTESVATDAFHTALLLTLAQARKSYDYIFLDAQAGEDAIAQITMRPDVSDDVVLVTEYDPMSAAGVDRLKAHLAPSLTYERTWILINKMLPEFASSVGDFLEIVRYLSPVPWDANVVRAYARRTLAIDLERGNDYTIAVTRTLKGLLGPGMVDEVDKWISSRAGALREPLIQQVEDVEVELRGLLQERAILTERRSRLRLFWTGLVGYAGAGGAGAVALLTQKLYVFGFAALVISACLVGLGALTRERWRTGQAANEIEDSRLRRREAALEDRLRRLELLIDATPEDVLSDSRPPS